MILYVLRRLLQLVPVFLCASFLIFSIIHLLPGDPVQVMLGEERYDETQYQILRKKLGLDDEDGYRDTVRPLRWHF